MTKLQKIHAFSGRLSPERPAAGASAFDLRLALHLLP